MFLSIYLWVRNVVAFLLAGLALSLALAMVWATIAGVAGVPAPDRQHLLKLFAVGPVAGVLAGVLCFHLYGVGKAANLDRRIRKALQMAGSARNPAAAADRIAEAEQLLERYGFNMDYIVERKVCHKEFVGSWGWMHDWWERDDGQWVEGSPDPVVLQTLRVQFQDLASMWTDPPTNDVAQAFRLLLERTRQESEVRLRDWLCGMWLCRDRSKR